MVRFKAQRHVSKTCWLYASSNNFSYCNNVLPKKELALHNDSWINVFSYKKRRKYNRFNILNSSLRVDTIPSGLSWFSSVPTWLIKITESALIISFPAASMSDCPIAWKPLIKIKENIMMIGFIGDCITAYAIRCNSYLNSFNIIICLLRFLYCRVASMRQLPF